MPDATIIPFPRKYRPCSHVVSRGATVEEQERGIDWVCETCGMADPHRGDLL
jgi:hypothetical protein